MLSTEDLRLIVATTLACTVVIVGAGVLVLRASRGASILTKLTIVLTSAIAAVVASTVAAAGEMFLGSHELVVMVWIVGISAVASTAAAWLVLHRTVRVATAGLVASARQLAVGGDVEPLASGWHEFDRVSAELAETAASLAATRAELQRLESSRRQFFAWISHDLRTPLTGIRAMAEALEDGLAPRPLDYAAHIRSKVDTLDRMVDDLFELSTLETGTHRLHPETVTLLDLVSDAVADVRSIAAARRVTIVHDGIEGVSLWADPQELTRALGNILSNGVRYAPENSTVVVSAVADASDQVILSVRDRGEGVDEADLPRVFDVGWRADAARAVGPTTTGRGLTNAGATGAGLGLAIVRGIAEAHGGTARAANEPDGFRLDLILPAPPPKAGVRDQAEGGELPHSPAPARASRAASHAPSTLTSKQATANAIISVPNASR